MKQEIDTEQLLAKVQYEGRYIHIDGKLPPLNLFDNDTKQRLINHWIRITDSFEAVQMAEIVIARAESQHFMIPDWSDRIWDERL